MKSLAIHRPALGLPDDFCHAIDGELAVPFVVCDNRDCGCDRACIGLNSGKGSTTVRVVEVDITEDDLAFAVAGYIDNAGWGHLFTDPSDARNAADRIARQVRKVAAPYGPDTVLRPRHDRALAAWTFTPVC